MSRDRNPEEQRSFQRIPNRALIEVHELSYPLPTGPGKMAKARNIAKGGICFVTPTRYPSGSLLNIRIGLKNWRRQQKKVSLIVDDSRLGSPLTAILEVAWSKKLRGGGYEIGGRFVNIHEDEYQALQAYLTSIEEVGNGD